MSTKIWIGIGTNLGDKLANIRAAIDGLQSVDIDVVRTSSIYETEPVGFASDSEFLNAVLECKTDLSPEEVLTAIAQIESEMGRTRSSTERYTSRIIDLDILLFGDQIITTKNLEIPHPRLTDRKFVLEPLSELIPDQIHPQKQLTINQLLVDCPDQNKVKISSKPLAIGQ